MTELMAAKIADGEDLLRPPSWRGHDLAPYIAAGVLRVKCYDPDEFLCNDCDRCLEDPPTVLNISGRYVVPCTPGKVRQVDASEIAIYEIDVGAVVGLIAKELGCDEPRVADGMAGVWRLGLSRVKFAKHKRQVWFFRTFDDDAAQRLSAIPDSGMSAIVIAASLGAGLGEGVHPFSLSELMRVDGGALCIDLDPIRLRLEGVAEQRRKEKRATKNPSKTMVRRMRKLADYLKTLAIGFIRSRKNGTESIETVQAKMKALTQKSIAEQIGIETNTLSRYLDEKYHLELKEVQAARLWYLACKDIDFQETVAETIHEHWPNATHDVDRLSGVGLYDEIHKQLEEKIGKCHAT